MKEDYTDVKLERELDWYVRVFNTTQSSSISFIEWFVIVRNIPIDVLVVYYKPEWIIGPGKTLSETYKFQCEYLLINHNLRLEPMWRKGMEIMEYKKHFRNIESLQKFKNPCIV